MYKIQEERFGCEFKAKRKKFLDSIDENESYESVCARAFKEFKDEEATAIKLVIPIEFSKNVVFRLCAISTKGKDISYTESKKIFKHYFSRFGAKNLNTAYSSLDKSVKRFFVRYFEDIAKEATKIQESPLKQLNGMITNSKDYCPKTIDSVNAILLSYRKTIEDENSQLIGFDKNISEAFIKGYCYDGEITKENEADILKAKEKFDGYMENNFKHENRQPKRKLMPSVKNR